MTHKPDDERDDLADNGVLDGGISVETSSITLMPLPLPTTTVSIAFPSRDEDDDMGDDVVEGEISLDEHVVSAAEPVDDEAEPDGDETDSADDQTSAESDSSAVEDEAESAASDAEDADDDTGIEEDVASVVDAEDDADDVSDVNASADDSGDVAVEVPESDDTAAHEDTASSEDETPIPDAAPERSAPVSGAIDLAPLAAAAAPLTRRAAATGPLRAQRRATSEPTPAVTDAEVAQSAPRPAATVARGALVAEAPMTSRRIGEVAQEAERETPDLLTSDRLVENRRLTRPEPEGAWAHLLYSLSGGRINIGDSKKARARKDLDRRIASPLPGGARFVAVTSRKGGVGKTTVTTLLGMALASAREDRVVAVDANPDRGTLADRISRQSGKTVRDLVRQRDSLRGFNDVSDIVARDETRLDVLASDTDPHVSEAFSAEEYHAVADVAAHYYSIVLTDTGTGIVHSVMGATLDLSHQLIVVTGPSVDESRLASETLTWLEMNGFADRVRDAIVVVNSASPGAPMVRLNEIEQHFGSRVREVVRIPYDSLIAAGGAIVFHDLQPATREAARTLAARVVEGLRAPREA